jgi:hypothetical protein
LREKTINFDWRADPLIPKVKRAFGSRLAGVLEFITLGDEDILHYYPLAKTQQKKAKWPSCSRAAIV